MNRLVMILTVFTIVTFASIRSQEVHKDSFKVCAIVTTDNEILETNMLSYLNRELRSLNDVVIVDSSENMDYGISITVLEQTFESGKKTGGLAFSTAIIKRTFCGDIYVSGWIQMGIMDNLKQLCASNIASFDLEILEPIRKTKSIGK